MPGKMPVIIGISEVANDAREPNQFRSPKELMVEAALSAASDAGLGPDFLASLDHLTAIRLFADFSAAFPCAFGSPENTPWSVAQALGAKNAGLEYSQGGGDTPQTSLASAAARIASGEIRSALIVGAEAMLTERKATAAGVMLDWKEPGPHHPDNGLRSEKHYHPIEMQQGLNLPVIMYALLDNALRGKEKLSVAKRADMIGSRLEKFAQVANANPLLKNHPAFSAQEIVEPSNANRLVTTPYTKRMMAEPFVDLSAAVLLCSEELADELGVAKEKRAYLWGHGQANDEWLVSERQNLAQSPAVRLAAKSALAQAGIGLDDIALFDIYSCFPSAIDIVASEIGLKANDERALTTTGGLPYFGGPGNNYSTHAIASMIRYLRKHPQQFGMVTANGGALTKHAVGIYSCQRPKQMPAFDAKKLQAEVDSAWGAKATIASAPTGHASIETYTIMYGKNGPAKGFVLAKKADTNERCIAVLPKDPEVLARLAEQDLLGVFGALKTEQNITTFYPN